MSLINDALKRAKQVQAPQATLPAQETPLQPVMHPPRPPRSQTWMPPAASAAILLLALFFLSLWWRGSQRVAALELQQAKRTTDLAQAPAKSAPSVPMTLADPVPAPLILAASVQSHAAAAPIPSARAARPDQCQPGDSE